MYHIEVLQQKPDNQRYIGIDIGVDNLATVCNNAGKQAFIINGKPLKSINQYYNKAISHYREICKRMNHSDYSQRMDRLTEKRNAKIDDYLHKASRYIISYCLETCHSYNRYRQEQRMETTYKSFKKSESRFCTNTFCTAH